MKKFLRNISIIQIILFVVVFFLMYLPVVKINANTNSTYNSFLCIFGIKAEKESYFNKWYSFSFMCLLPYLLLLVTVAINIFFDNRKALWAHITKIVLFSISIVLLAFFQKLMVPVGISKDNVLKWTDNLYGNFVQMAVVIIMLASSIIELLIDFNVIDVTERSEG